jgi:hypothetical protein
MQLFRSLTGWGPRSLLKLFSMVPVFQTWKVDIDIIFIGQQTMFQWGHVFSDMERLYPDPYPCISAIVSMGPRLFRHGKSGNFSASAVLEKNPRYEHRPNCQRFSRF